MPDRPFLPVWRLPSPNNQRGRLLPSRPIRREWLAESLAKAAGIRYGQADAWVR